MVFFKRSYANFCMHFPLVKRDGENLIPPHLNGLKIADIDSGRCSNAHKLASTIGKDDVYVSRIIRFTLLAPPIEDVIFVKECPEHELNTTLSYFRKKQVELFSMA